MSLAAVPASERVHIGFFGKRNAGKSSVMNAVTGQDLAIVSEQKGTTTDPVYKTMELLPLGAVMLMDTPGLDDEGNLGAMRVKKAYQVLNKTDIALVVIDASCALSQEDRELVARIRRKKIPYLLVFNKEDLLSDLPEDVQKEKKREMEAFFAAEKFQEEENTGKEILEKKVSEKEISGKEVSGNEISGNEIYRNKIFGNEAAGSENADEEEPGKPTDAVSRHTVWISARKKEGIYELKERMAHLLDQEKNGRQIVRDIIRPGNFVVLVVPIDEAAPKGRLILPQQQTIREILETGATAVVVRDVEYRETLEKLGRKPDLVITDSQVFEQVAGETPQDVLLTSFSILFARYKGILFPAVHGARALEGLMDGDRVLLSEGCTHHRQCNDIGTVKLPAWIRAYTKKDLTFCFTSGTEFPGELGDYRLIVHCGGCMLNAREMNYRLNCAQDQAVPMTNYGTLIAYMKGILERSLKPFDTGK